MSGPSQPNKLDLDPREDVVPSVTFKERRSLRTLTGLDHIQSQQRAGELHLFSCKFTMIKINYNISSTDIMRLHCLCKVNACNKLEK